MNIAALLSACTLATTALAVPKAIEVSEDGRDSLRLADAPPAGVLRGIGSLPFGLSPDVEIMLRRQIGGLAVADMNADGFNDLIAVCYISNSFPPYTDWREMIFYGSAAGIATTPGWISDNQTHAGDVQIGDVNGDSNPDIVVIRGGSVRADAVQVYFGSPTGPATSPGYSSNIPGRAWGTSGDLVDMDNDGDLDLVTTNQGLSPDPFRPIMIFRNGGAGLGVTPDWTSAEAEISNGVTHADILGSDGLPEIIAAKWVNFQSSIYENIMGTPVPFAFMSVPMSSADKGAAAGDVTGDGLIEVAFGGDPVRLYQSVHGALLPLWEASPPFGGSQEIRLHDADGDGDLDLADVIFGDGRAHIYENNSGVLDTTPTWTFDAPEVGTAIVFGDLNNDGRDDLVVGYSGNVSVRVFYGQAPDCPADLALPEGVLDLADLQTFISAFLAGDELADLAPPAGVLDLADVQAFVGAFLTGCP